MQKKSFLPNFLKIQFGGTKTSLETNIDQKPVPKQVESVTPSTCCCEGEVSGPADEETFAAKEGKQTCVVLRHIFRYFFSNYHKTCKNY
jgi:hypothetical protein